MNKYSLFLQAEPAKIEKMEREQFEGILEHARRIIGGQCDLVEVVRPMGLARPYVMLVDEEFMFHDKCSLNEIGSYLYETHKHGSPILGNAVIVKEIMTSQGPDLGWLSKEEMDRLFFKLINAMSFICSREGRTRKYAPHLLIPLEIEPQPIE